MIRIAINGFGRIGRNFLRTLLQDPHARNKVDIVAINLGPAKKEFTAHMFTYDTLMGTYHGSVALEGNELVIDGKRIQLLTELDPVKLPWKSLNIDWVVECTGHFTKREGASKHLQAGAQYVLISAPAHDEDVSIIPGVNDAMFNASKHKIVSLGSCTTNAVLTMLKVLHDTFTIERSFMTTVHAYTNSQVLLDVEAKDLRRSRAAAVNIIPTTTGAMNVMGKVIPDLAGCVEAIAIRVPVTKVSLIDLTIITKESLTVDAINAAFTKAAHGPMKGILA
ncbi:MAG: type I glyceraldehyde-3-phosphate dehydrogenase, partial [Candidatus Babeliales bacterium]